MLCLVVPVKEYKRMVFFQIVECYHRRHFELSAKFHYTHIDVSYFVHRPEIHDIGICKLTKKSGKLAHVPHLLLPLHPNLTNNKVKNG